MQHNKGIKIALIIVIACIALGIISIMASVISGRLSFGGFSWTENLKEVNQQKNETIIKGEGIKKLSIDHSKAPYDVIIKTTDKKDISIKEVIREDEEFARIEETSDGTLKIRATRMKPKLFSIWTGNIYTEILLPKDYSGEIEIDASSADIMIEGGLNLSDKLSISTTSGEIYIDELSAKEMKIDVSSGDVTLKNTQGEKKVSTTSGEIYIAKSTGNCEINASSGDVTINDGDGTFDISSTSGEVYVDTIKGSGKINTSSGDITAKVKEMDGNMDINATSGEVFLKLPSEPGFSFEANATSGEIVTFFDDNVKYNKKGNKAEGTIGNANLKVKVSTSSGDISMEEY